MVDRLSAAICDAQFLFRDGLYLLLKEEGFHVPVSVATHDELLKATRDFPDDIMILFSEDRISRSLIDTILNVRDVKPTSKIVLMLRDLDENARSHFERLGLNGILSKSIARNVLMRSIELVMLGEYVFSASCFQPPRRPQSDLNVASLLADTEGSHASVVSTGSANDCPSPPSAKPDAAPRTTPTDGDCTADFSPHDAARPQTQPTEPAQAALPVHAGFEDAEPDMTVADAGEVVSSASAVLVEKGLKDILINRDKLSARESEILVCLVEGASNKVIARQCDITEATVKVHLKAILRKIKVQNRTQAAVWMMQRMADSLNASARPSAERNPLHNRRSTDRPQPGFQDAEERRALLSSTACTPFRGAATYIEHRT